MMKLGCICIIQRSKNNPRIGYTVVAHVKIVQDTEVIKQGFGDCLLGQRLNFACRLPAKVCNHHAKYYVAVLDKLKQQVVSRL
jgi:hypothetical protein